MNNDLISRKALIYAYDKAHQGPPGVARKLMEEAPGVDAVEVVRCKDCKHASFYSCKEDACYRGIICEYQIGTDNEDFFCAYGDVRRDNNGDL